MARSWASIARTNVPAEAPVAAWTPPSPPAPPCHFCGNPADQCPRCVRHWQWHGGNPPGPVLYDGLCAGHLELAVPNAFYSKDMREFIPHTCAGCREANPWRPADHVEVVEFNYVPSCFCHPLSPTNAIRIPLHRFIRLGEKLTDPAKRADEAMAAYQKEMEFSKDEAAAMQVYRDFYRFAPRPSVLKSGAVSLVEIAAGQPVSGAQFFDAVKRGDSFPSITHHIEMMRRLKEDV